MTVKQGVKLIRKVAGPWTEPADDLYQKIRTQKVAAKDTLRIYWQHMSRYPRQLIILLTLMPVVVGIQSGLLPFIYSKVIDRLNGGAVLSDFSDLFPLFIGLYLIVFVGQRFINLASSNLEFRVIRDLEQRIFNWLLTQGHGFHINKFAGALVAQAKRFTGAYSSLYTGIYFNVFSLVFRFMVATVLLGFTAPLIAALLIAWTVLYLNIIIRLTRKKIHMSRAASNADSEVTAHLADAISNSMVVQMFGREGLESELYTSVSQSKYEKRKRDWRYSELIASTQALLMIGLEAVVLYYSILLVQNGTYTIGELALVQFFLGPILIGLWDIGRVVRNIETNLADASEMTAILKLNPEVSDPKRPLKENITRGEIQLKNVHFQYDLNGEKSRQLFNDLNLHIKPGEKVGLVGLSGSGKSTLSKLLLRFMDIKDGQIVIDGQDITKIRQKDLRRKIAFVPQEPLLFHRTIADNIRYGNPEASDEEVIEAAKKARADGFIQKLSEGYETMVGERGTKLSGGERQRVAIARAIMKNAPIVILDEATSALDSESEKLIQQSFNSLMKGRTAIVIAHRLSTIKHMDRIIVMDDGEIIEEGSHNQLLKHNGAYASLWEHQVNSAPSA